VLVLVVDDDPAIRRALERALSAEGYGVALAEDGEQALERVAFEPEPDVVLLDLGLPDVDGVKIVERLRADGNEIPILVLTARQALTDRVAGLDAGADDYLAKPFELDELLARVRALTRRSRVIAADAGDFGTRGAANAANATNLANQLQPNEISVADLRIDIPAHRVWRGNREIQLTRTEFNLLELLARNENIVLKRDQLLEEIWGWASETLSNSLEVYIGYLRRKLEANNELRLIHTVRGVGYVLRQD
jgi:two-component system response regulator MprA